MARLKSLLAIFLALALVISPASSSYADGPSVLNPTGGNTNDGHPWDDDVTESEPDPGNDPNTPGQNGVTSKAPLTGVAPTAMAGTGTQTVSGLIRIMLDHWLRVREIKAFKSRVGTARMR